MAVAAMMAPLESTRVPVMGVGQVWMIVDKMYVAVLVRVGLAHRSDSS
jgi:hypothetical protein